MQFKRISIFILFSTVLVFLWVLLFGMLHEISELKKTASVLSNAHEALIEENEQIAGEAEYYSYPANVEKLLRSRFNYKRPGENMIIVIPEDNQ